LRCVYSLLIKGNLVFDKYFKGCYASKKVAADNMKKHYRKQNILQSPFFRLSPFFIAILLTSMMLTSCASQYPLNPKTGTITKAVTPQTAKGQLLSQERTDSFLMLLAFSGGGTRAAAMSYGVLEALERIDIPIQTINNDAPPATQKHTLLDEVDIISSVSGGSFTAAYYGLHGKKIFNGYREAFLIKNHQSALLWSFLNPFNFWFRLMSPRFGRSDMAQEYYDEMIFKGAKMGDFIKNGGPDIIIQATDAMDGFIFSFTPGMFFMLCSNYNEFPVARAVAASAAFPGPLSPIVLKNYTGQCNCPVPPWITTALEKRDYYSRAYYNAVEMSKFLNIEEKPYIYLVDGGVSDNLGIKGPLESIISRGHVREVLKQQGMPNTEKVAIIIVDAQTKEQSEWGLYGKIPGLSLTLGASSGIMINKFNFETIELLHRYAKDWKAEDEAQGKKPIEFYIIHLTFNKLPDKAEQEYFLDIPTSLQLPEAQVDKLREVAGRLLYTDSTFQKLVSSLGGKIPEPPQVQPAVSAAALSVQPPPQTPVAASPTQPQATPASAPVQQVSQPQQTLAAPAEKNKVHSTRQ
jgi:NTE family protein